MMICDPATNQVVRELTPDGWESLQRKYELLKKGQKEWAAQPLRERLDCIFRFSALLEKNCQELAETLTMDMGKPIQQSRNEIRGARERIQYFLDHSKNWLSSQVVRNDGNTEEALSFEPLGVVGNISAWNYPYLVGVNVFVPALIGGNAVFYKPSKSAMLTGLKIAELLCAAQVPENALSVAIGDGSLGEKLLDLPLDGYFFTGSVKIGKLIAEKAASKLVPIGLELGGKDPLYVTDDLENLSKAVDSCVEGCFYNAGQGCCAVERLYLHEKIYDVFLEKFVEKVKTLRLGDPMKEETDVGPLARSGHLSFLEEQVEDAVSKGAKILTGGKRHATLKGYFEPTVAVDVDHTMELMQEESFGPIIGIQKVKDDEEAVTLMNDTSFGLTAAVYSRDIARARSILEKLDVGTGYVNCCDRVTPYLPWSGRRDSGVGSTLSYLGILAFVKPKAFQVRRG